MAKSCALFALPRFPVFSWLLFDRVTLHCIGARCGTTCSIWHRPSSTGTILPHGLIRRSLVGSTTSLVKPRPRTVGAVIGESVQAHHSAQDTAFSLRGAK
eukprot:COSAG02_NODE_38396_length_429_cov_1.096970_1_plen_99_part_10